MTESSAQQHEKTPTQADIERLRSRFIKAEAKIVKLENLIQNFEQEHGSIEQVEKWIVDTEKLRLDICSKHQECVNAVENNKNAFNALIAKKSQEANSIIEEESQKIKSFAQKKTDDISSSVQEKLTEFESNMTSKRSELDTLLAQVEEEANIIHTAYGNSTDDQKTISDIKELIENQKETIDQHLTEIARILSDAQKALTSATSAGLAKDFEAQKKALKDSQTKWMWGLIAALVAATLVAYCRFDSMLALLASEEPISDFNLFINCLLSVTAIAAPVWFAWLATKQIGYNFRLSEDYAFKAATAASFEGFRKEIEALTQGDTTNDELRVRLLSTLLARLDEQPLRYVDNKTEGSPFHEFLQKLPPFRKGNKSEDQSSN